MHDREVYTTGYTLVIQSVYLFLPSWNGYCESTDADRGTLISRVFVENASW